MNPHNQKQKKQKNLNSSECRKGVKDERSTFPGNFGPNEQFHTNN